jgi:hypothetical protein
MEGAIDEDDVSCSICLELMQLPTPLPCSHVFCRPCLLSFSARAELSCPMCRAVFSLPLRPVDTSLAARVALFSKQQSDALKAAVTTVMPPFLRRDEWLVILKMLEKTEGPSVVARVGTKRRSSGLLCLFFLFVFLSGAVCRGLYRVAQDGYVWRELCIRDFAFVPADDEGIKPSWRRRYDSAKKRARGWKLGKPSDWKLTTLRGPTSHVLQIVPLARQKVYIILAGQLFLSVLLFFRSLFDMPTERALRGTPRRNSLVPTKLLCASIPA